MAKSDPYSFRILVASNLFFIVASIFYCISSGLQLQNHNEDESIESPDTRGLLFGGALCFVIVGALDFYNHRPRTWFHLTLIFAGVCGCISAVAEPKSNTQIAFNWASTHFYLLESLQLLFRHVKKKNDESKGVRGVRLVADAEFFLGAVLDVVLSYVYAVRQDEPTSAAAVKVDMVSCMFWLIAALLTTALSLYLGKDSVKPPKESNETSQMTAQNGSEQLTTTSFQVEMSWWVVQRHNVLNNQQQIKSRAAVLDGWLNAIIDSPCQAVWCNVWRFLLLFVLSFIKLCFFLIEYSRSNHWHDSVFLIKTGKIECASNWFLLHRTAQRIVTNTRQACSFHLKSVVRLVWWISMNRATLSEAGKSRAFIDSPTKVSTRVSKLLLTFSWIKTGLIVWQDGNCLVRFTLHVLHGERSH